MFCHCLTQITSRGSLAPPPQSLTEGRRSLPSPISQRYHHQPVAHPPPPNRPPPPLHHKPPIKFPPSASERYQAATQPPIDANQLRLHNSNSSVSEASLSLPAPLTNCRRDSEATDPVQSGFEANRRYIGEDINREIRHEARRYKEGNVAVEPANADAEEWPFDPNLTCTFCGTMFRRGQIREFRYHIDECTARSMEGRKYFVERTPIWLSEHPF